MATSASIGYGSKFALATAAAPTTFVDVAEVTDITPPSDKIDVIDATNMDSPNGTREFIIGLNDPGECSFEMNFIPGSAGDDQIQAIRDARLPVPCRITFPNDVTWSFTGILTGYEPAVPTEDKMMASVTFKVTGSYVTGVAA